MLSGFYVLINTLQRPRRLKEEESEDEKSLENACAKIICNLQKPVYKDKQK